MGLLHTDSIQTGSINGGCDHIGSGNHKNVSYVNTLKFSTKYSPASCFSFFFLIIIIRSPTILGIWNISYFFPSDELYTRTHKISHTYVPILSFFVLQIFISGESQHEPIWSTFSANTHPHVSVSTIITDTSFSFKNQPFNITKFDSYTSIIQLHFQLNNTKSNDWKLDM